MSFTVAFLVRFFLVFHLAFAAPVRQNRNKTIVPTRKIDLENVTLPESFHHTINYETRGGGIQGDMIFPDGENPFDLSETRGVATAGYRTWPDNIIPYDLSGIRSASHRQMITDAMEKLMYAVGSPMQTGGSRRPCVYFRPRTSSDRYYVRFQFGQGCSGTVGYWPGTDMVITLQNPGCFTYGIIQHELIHVLGFYHEQSRPDRDSYVSVYYDNIDSYARFNFDKLQWGRSALNQNTPYDLQSIMHYDAYAFSRNGQPTIIPRRSNVAIGQRQALSPTDIAEIRNYYQC